MWYKIKENFNHSMNMVFFYENFKILVCQSPKIVSKFRPNAKNNEEYQIKESLSAMYIRDCSLNNYSFRPVCVCVYLFIYTFLALTVAAFLQERGCVFATTQMINIDQKYT